jgi:hypothetical protein
VLSVVWHFRMNYEGRTCIGREVRTEKEPCAVQLVRMQEHLEIEQAPSDVFKTMFPLLQIETTRATASRLPEAAKQYLLHAANGGASKEVVDFLATLYKPPAALRARLDVMLTPPAKKEPPSC